MWSTLMLICLVFGDEMFAADANINITSKEFRPIEVSSTTLLTAIRTEELVSYSEMTCAMLAAQRPWSHLMCFDEHLCQVNDLVLPSSHQEVSAEGIRSCYTDIHKQCIHDGQVLEEGETVTDSSCIAKKCTNTVLSQVYPGVPITCSDASFEYVPGVGCLGIFLSYGYVSRTTAETNCGTKGATLVIPEIFEALQDYLTCKAGVWFWVGAVGTNWDDGTPIDSTYWQSGQPEVVTDCVLIVNVDGGYFLKTNPCTWSHSVLCQLP